MRSLLPLALLTLFLAACGGGPRQQHIPYSQASRMTDPMTVEVIQSWDLIEYATRADPNVSHLIEVRVIQGPSQYEGEVITLPYDSFSVGPNIPANGSEMVMMPAMWLRPAGAAMGRPGRR